MATLKAQTQRCHAAFGVPQGKGSHTQPLPPAQHRLRLNSCIFGEPGTQQVCQGLSEKSLQIAPNKENT